MRVKDYFNIHWLRKITEEEIENQEWWRTLGNKIGTQYHLQDMKIRGMTRCGKSIDLSPSSKKESNFTVDCLCLRCLGPLLKEKHSIDIDTRWLISALKEMRKS